MNYIECKFEQELGKISHYLDLELAENLYKFDVSEYAFIDSEHLFIKVFNALSQFAANLEKEFSCNASARSVVSWQFNDAVMAACYSLKWFEIRIGVKKWCQKELYTF